jgi:hypothetical protein
MPRIERVKAYGGAKRRISRLGLMSLWHELHQVLTEFQLFVKEARHANGAAAIRNLIDARFTDAGGWTRLRSGGVDWVKCQKQGAARVCLGVEVQISARSDMLIVDVVHLRDAIVAGDLDVGIIAVPSDKLAPFLPDRTPYFKHAIETIRRAKAEDWPIGVVALLHDGAGDAIPKRITNRGKGRELA